MNIDLDIESETEANDDSDGSLDGKTKIEDSNFSPRTTNALVNAGIKTIAGLKRLSPLKLEVS